MTGQLGTPAHLVTADHLRRLATVDRRSLFAGADALIDAGDEIIRVPFSVVAAALEGRTRLACCGRTASMFRLTSLTCQGAGMLVGGTLAGSGTVRLPFAAGAVIAMAAALAPFTVWRAKAGEVP